MRVSRPDDETIQISVSDSGPGVESPERKFQPFFSAKEHGMGMGLAIYKSIVDSRGGHLWVESNAPQGATFAISLPIKSKAS